tara:strand:+ start:1270 stop:2007 length:738 start_codon:yes stop_codon:yes gene_type:complete
MNKVYSLRPSIGSQGPTWSFCENKTTLDGVFNEGIRISCRSMPRDVIIPPNLFQAFIEFIQRIQNPEDLLYSTDWLECTDSQIPSLKDLEILWQVCASGDLDKDIVGICPPENILIDKEPIMIFEPSFMLKSRMQTPADEECNIKSVLNEYYERFVFLFIGENKVAEFRENDWQLFINTVNKIHNIDAYMYIDRMRYVNQVDKVVYIDISLNQAKSLHSSVKSGKFKMIDNPEKLIEEEYSRFYL